MLLSNLLTLAHQHLVPSGRGHLSHQLLTILGGTLGRGLQVFAGEGLGACLFADLLWRNRFSDKIGLGREHLRQRPRLLQAVFVLHVLFELRDALCLVLVKEPARRYACALLFGRTVPLVVVLSERLVLLALAVLGRLPHNVARDPLHGEDVHRVLGRADGHVEETLGRHLVVDSVTHTLL